MKTEKQIHLKQVEIGDSFFKNINELDQIVINEDVFFEKINIIY